MTEENARFRLQRISNEIKAIGDRSTLLLGYLVIILAALTAFVFTDSGEIANQLRFLSTTLLALYVANASITLGLLALSFETPSDDEIEDLEMLKEKISANLKRLNALKFWFRVSTLIAFTSLISVLVFAIYSLV